MKRFQFYIFCLLASVSVGASAYDNSDIQKEAELMRLNSTIKDLDAEIAQIESEQRRCEKAKKNWTVATVVGGVGVVGTGVGAVVQSKQINTKKDELKKLK